MRVDIYIEDDNFARGVIPSIFISLLKEKVYQLRNKQMNDYLLKHYKVSLNYVVSKLPYILTISERDKKYTLSIDRNFAIRELGAYAIDILGVLDKGNLEIRGTNILSDTFNEVRGKQHLLYSLYLKGGIRLCL